MDELPTELVHYVISFCDDIGTIINFFIVCKRISTKLDRYHSKLIAEYLWVKEEFSRFSGLYIFDIIICYNKSLLLKWYLDKGIDIQFGRYGINHGINRGCLETLKLLIEYKKYKFIKNDLNRASSLYFCWDDRYVTERKMYISKEKWEGEMLQLQEFIKFNV